MQEQKGLVERRVPDADPGSGIRGIGFQIISNICSPSEPLAPFI
jgi:hypothetical protein